MNKPECKIDENDGTKSWWLNRKLHREDGPAIEWSNGSKSWYLNGELHREDGPAYVDPDGTKEWCLNGNPTHPEVLVDLWLEREVFCWWDETTQTLNFTENNE